MLYAFGLPAARPISIPMRTVLSRCTAFIPELGGRPASAATALVERRNSELHTGETAFADLPNALWLADFFRVSDLLLHHQGKTLEDLFGEDEAIAASEMLRAADEEDRANAQRRCGVAKHAFENLDPAEQEERKIRGSAEARLKKPATGRIAACPACGADAVISGAKVGETEPRLDDEDIVFDEIILPNTLLCYSCGLELRSHAALHVFGLGGQLRIEWRTDAIEHYSEQIDPADFFEPEYGND